MYDQRNGTEITICRFFTQLPQVSTFLDPSIVTFEQSSSLRTNQCIFFLFFFFLAKYFEEKPAC